MWSTMPRRGGTDAPDTAPAPRSFRDEFPLYQTIAIGR
ncbi:hypothetical protein LMG23994_00415 [Cupriavidus pinatubonensis]|uniref:Uncharacterized protein n=1 Tax=Cupriavidus pinatubonensis TaxID=248026 RepID=A0ABN7XY32_9BURK|nr:hypothetical protein LMG23994_00415 [Cupriavidus pinatubonensis]